MDKRSSNVSGFNIVQWNSQSLRPKLSSFSAFLNQERIHLAIISESWLEEESPLNISEYNIYRRDRMDGYGGVSIITHKSVQAQCLYFNHSYPGIEDIGVQIFNCKDIKNVISVYCPSTIRTSPVDWDTLFSKFKSKTLIAGDFNGHHTNWFDKCDTRGLQIFDSALENSFIALNDGQPTRIKLVNQIMQKSAPDVTFASSDIAANFLWQTTNENFGRTS